MKTRTLITSFTLLFIFSCAELPSSSDNEQVKDAEPAVNAETKILYGTPIKPFGFDLSRTHMDYMGTAKKTGGC